MGFRRIGCKNNFHKTLDLTFASASAAVAAARRSEPPSAAARTSAARTGLPATRQPLKKIGKQEDQGACNKATMKGEDRKVRLKAPATRQP